MKGTTLTELNDAYDIFFFELAVSKKKLIPRGKTFIRLLTLCKQADFYD